MKAKKTKTLKAPKEKKEKIPFTNAYLCDIIGDTTAIPEGKYDGVRTGRDCNIKVNGKQVMLETEGWTEGENNPCIIVISKRAKTRARVFSFFA